MTRDQDAQALADLRRRADLSEVPVDLLIRTAKLAKQERDQMRDYAGRAAEELNRKGMSWKQIGEALGVPTMTIYDWAKDR